MRAQEGPTTTNNNNKKKTKNNNTVTTTTTTTTSTTTTTTTTTTVDGRGVDGREEGVLLWCCVYTYSYQYDCISIHVYVCVYIYIYIYIIVRRESRATAMSPSEGFMSASISWNVLCTWIKHSVGTFTSWSPSWTSNINHGHHGHQTWRSFWRLSNMGIKHERLDQLGGQRGHVGVLDGRADHDEDL